MEFEVIAELFSKLDNTSKRLEKVAILNDFFSKNIKLEPIKLNGNKYYVVPLIFAIIAGNFQRETNKRSIGISLKTIFSVISFVSQNSEKDVEKYFNKIGDVGLTAKNFLKDKNQSSFSKKKLTLQDIINSLDKISKTSGTNKNKIKKEILANLFIQAKTDNEKLFLGRLLIDDLRIGVSEGVLRETCVHTLFPKIIGINIEESEKHEVIEISTPKEVIGLDEFIGERDKEELIKSVLRLDPKKYIIKTDNQRNLYNLFTSLFEKEYNTISSFNVVYTEIKDNLQNILNIEIDLFKPVKSMLGVRTNSIEDSFDVTGKPALLDFKYDGLRVQIHNDCGEVKLFSRNLEDITKQFPEVVKYIKDNFSNTSFVLDSECVGFDFKKMEFLPFQVLSRRILTKNIDSVNHIKVVVKAFDIFFKDGKTLIDESYETRREILEGLFTNIKLKQPMIFEKEKLINCK